MSEWIKVKDGLPRSDCFTLIAFDGKSVFMASYSCLSGFYIVDGDGIAYSVDDVSHWASLPLPPKD